MREQRVCCFASITLAANAAACYSAILKAASEARTRAPTGQNSFNCGWKNMSEINALRLCVLLHCNSTSEPPPPPAELGLVTSSFSKRLHPSIEKEFGSTANMHGMNIHFPPLFLLGIRRSS